VLDMYPNEDKVTIMFREVMSLQKLILPARSTLDVWTVACLLIHPHTSTIARLMTKEIFYITLFSSMLNYQYSIWDHRIYCIDIPLERKEKKGSKNKEDKVRYDIINLNFHYVKIRCANFYIATVLAPSFLNRPRMDLRRWCLLYGQLK
jgi:hypothetical protein